MPNMIANIILVSPSGSHESGYIASSPAIYHTNHVVSATATTKGTKTFDILSANAWIGAFASCAFSTSLMICESEASAPTRTARMINAPPELRVPPTRPSPIFLRTGRDSPVIIDSSVWTLFPSTNTPSAAMRDPGKTFSRSPRWIRVDDIVSSEYSLESMPGTSLRRMAEFGVRSKSFEMASDVDLLAADSKYLPRSMKVINIVLVSKKSLPKLCPVSRQWNMRYMLVKYATLVARETRTSMFADPFFSDLYAPMWNRDPMENCTGVAKPHFKNEARVTF